MLILRVLHIGAGVLWAGGTMMIAWFVSPSARKTGPAAGPFMEAFLKSKVVQVGTAANVVTVATGIWLISSPNGVQISTWQDSVLVIGALAGMLASVFAFGRQRPTALALSDLGATIAASGGPPTVDQAGEMQRLQAAMGRGANIIRWWAWPSAADE